MLGQCGDERVELGQRRAGCPGALQLVLVPDGPAYGVAIDPDEWPLPIVDGQEVRTSGWRPSDGLVAVD